MAFLARLSALAGTVEADVCEMKAAAAAPAGSSGSSACCESVLSGAKEEIETVRDELLRVQRSLTSPSLAELCQRFHAIAASNQRMLDQIECQFEADPAMKYKAFTRGEATTAVPCLAAASPAADDSPADAAVGVPLVVQEPCQGRAGAQERSSIGSTGSFNSLAGRYENCSSPSPLSLPSHLQVEPKTPDLEDFAISSVAIRLLNTDDVENSSPNAPHAISLLSKKQAPAPDSEIPADIGTAIPTRMSAAMDSPTRAEANEEADSDDFLTRYALPSAAAPASAPTDVTDAGARAGAAAAGAKRDASIDVAQGSASQMAAPDAACATRSECKVALSRDGAEDGSQADHGVQADQTPNTAADLALSASSSEHVPPAPVALQGCTEGEGGGGGATETDTGSSRVMSQVTAEDFEAVPAYKRTAVSLLELNDTITQMNAFMRDKQAKDGDDEAADSQSALSIAEMQQEIKLGAKTKTFVLLLTHLARLKPVKRNDTIVYSFV